MSVIHEFVNAIDPQWPVALPLHETYTVTKTEVRRVAEGPIVEEDSYVFTHYVWIGQGEDAMSDEHLALLERIDSVADPTPPTITDRSEK